MTVLMFQKTTNKISQIGRLDNVYSIVEMSDPLIFDGERFYRMNVTGVSNNYDYRKSTTNIAVLFE